MGENVLRGMGSETELYQLVRRAKARVLSEKWRFGAKRKAIKADIQIRYGPGGIGE